MRHIKGQGDDDALFSIVIGGFNLVALLVLGDVVIVDICEADYSWLV